MQWMAAGPWAEAECRSWALFSMWSWAILMSYLSSEFWFLPVRD